MVASRAKHRTKYTNDKINEMNKTPQPRGVWRSPIVETNPYNELKHANFSKHKNIYYFLKYCNMAWSDLLQD